jgi:hypothetical protein
VQGRNAIRSIRVDESGWSYEQTRSVSLQGPDSGTLSERGVLRHEGDKTFSYIANGNADGTARVHVDWGTPIKGLDSVDAKVVGGRIAGSVDGRAFFPLSLDADLASAIFADGKPAPRAETMSGWTKEQLTRLDAKITAVISACEPVTSLDEGREDPTARAVAPGLDSGHPGDAYAKLLCDGCKAGVVMADSSGCGVACSATPGLACAGCLARVALDVPLATLECEMSPACCPSTSGGETTSQAQLRVYGAENQLPQLGLSLLK